MDIYSFINEKTTIAEDKIKNTVKLLQEDNTIPFIARYRKEKTGFLDEVQIEEIDKWRKYYNEIIDRKETILKSIEEQGKLSDELKKKIETTWDKQKLEDIYLPYKPKKRTRAKIAREKGLENLYKFIKEFAPSNEDLEKEATKYINEEKKVNTIEDAIKGAFDIWAEEISEIAELREDLRNLFFYKGILKSVKREKAEDEKGLFKDYYEYEENIRYMAAHRYLAIKRGETKGVLRFSIEVKEEDAIDILYKYTNQKLKEREYTNDVLKDAYNRLLKPSIEAQIRQEKKDWADDVSIEIFRKNLEALLLSSPATDKIIMGIDPGLRTGSKICIIDKTGKVLATQTIYPQKDKEGSKKTLISFFEKYTPDVISIGNGTGSKEIYSFVKSINNSPPIVIVNEAGASVYSASAIAREELPNLDVSMRGAVSIARRLQDPLSELVKIDPKSIGVGQYQHDVNKKKLSLSLENVVISAVNKVGVDVNTASWTLLRYVSGIGETLAKRIVEYRNEKGRFASREEIKKVKGMGAKAFQQSAGFLRIKNGENPLDSSAVHPESYFIVEEILKDINIGIEELMGNEELINRIDTKKYIEKGYGEYTLNDIKEELKKPGRDPRKKWAPFIPSDKVDSINDLEVGMVLPGMVTSITAFGVFVDIGVHRDGMIHVSKLNNRKLSPGEVIKVQVSNIDIDRNRIGLILMKNE